MDVHAVKYEGKRRRLGLLSAGAPPHGKGFATKTTAYTAQGLERGRDARTVLDLPDQAELVLPAGRDPLALLAESDEGRLESLIPLRHKRMTASPFAFLRGLPALMTADLAAMPSSGVQTQLAGDAHLANFGFFFSPERELVFDLNDFDETAEGPFEWDVKRLATSVAVAGKTLAMPAKHVKRAVEASVCSYRKHMLDWAKQGSLALWYAHVDAEAVARQTASHSRALVAGSVQSAMRSTGAAAAAKLTQMVDGRRQLRPDPPLLSPVPADDPVGGCLEELLKDYLGTVEFSRRRLLERFHFLGGALKVVGIGSVGTRCYVLLMEDAAGGPPLFLQAKQEHRSAIDIRRGTPSAGHQGERVINGQRLLQALSDPFLGWGTDNEIGGHFALRQLRDGKGEVMFERLPPQGFDDYAALCGSALARAHARAGSPAAIAGYLGKKERFDQAVTIFAFKYAEVVQSDHKTLVDAMAEGWPAR